VARPDHPGVDQSLHGFFNSLCIPGVRPAKLGLDRKIGAGVYAVVSAVESAKICIVIWEYVGVAEDEVGDTWLTDGVSNLLTFPL